MKSVIAQGSTVAKAIEEALKKANMPQEFFVKILEDAQPGFLGFGAKKAKIALFFEEIAPQAKHHETMFEKNSYKNLFNNPNLRKQIEQQLKEAGLEIKPIQAPKKQQPVAPQKALTEYSSSNNIAQLKTRPLPDKPKQMHQRPLPNHPKNNAERPHLDRTLDQTANTNALKEEHHNTGDRPARKRSRYFRPRRPQQPQSEQKNAESSFFKDSDDSEKF